MTNQPLTSGQGAASELSFMDALKYPFDDKEWLKKVAIGGVLVITIIGGIPLAGYGVRLARRVMRGEPGLPEWDDFGGDITRGLYVLVGNIIHFLPIIILACIVAALQFVLIPPSSSRSFSSSASGAGAFASTLVALCAIPIYIVIGIPLILINISALARFAATNQFSVYTDFSTLIADVRKNIRSTLFLLIDVWVYQLIMGIGAQIGFVLCCLPGLGVAAMASMGYFYIAGRWGLKLGLRA